MAMTTSAFAGDDDGVHGSEALPDIIERAPRGRAPDILYGCFDFDSRSYDVPDYMNTPQVAKILGVNIQTVREYIRSGELPAARVGRRYVITRDDVDRFIHARKGARRSESVGLTEKGRETVQRVRVNAGRVGCYLDDCPGAGNEEISEAIGISEDDTQRALRWLEGRKLAHCELDKVKPDRCRDAWYPGGATD